MILALDENIFVPVICVFQGWDNGENGVTQGQKSQRVTGGVKKSAKFTHPFPDLIGLNCFFGPENLFLLPPSGFEMTAVGEKKIVFIFQFFRLIDNNIIMDRN